MLYGTFLRDGRAGAAIIAIAILILLALEVIF